MHPYPAGKPYELLQQNAAKAAGEKIAIDLFGPVVRSSKGNQYLWAVVDTFTRWIELYPQSGQCATDWRMNTSPLRHPLVRLCDPPVFNYPDTIQH